MIMTMPDLETFHIKRSKSHPVHYIYMFHSMVSTHLVYRKSAFDNYDTIFCVGEHHLDEIQNTEKYYKEASAKKGDTGPVSYTHLRAHETREDRG